MEEEIYFDYESYIQEHLKEIDDLDERRYAKELLLDGLGSVFRWTEEKYRALEQRIVNELAVPWEHFCVSMTVAEKNNYDPINGFWHPVWEEDLKGEADGREYMTIYLAAEEWACREFLQMDAVLGTEEKTGRQIRFRIRKSGRYIEAVEKLYTLFCANHVPWQTIHMGHLERFFDLVPEEEIPADSIITFRWEKWTEWVREDFIPLWNIGKSIVQSQEFRYPCLDEVVYEHIYHIGSGREKDGCLVEVDGDILSVRHEKNKVLVRMRQEMMESVTLYWLQQGDTGNSYSYRYPVLSNRRKDSFAARYLHRTGSFIQTPMELSRKIGELAGGCGIRLEGYEITDYAEGRLLEGDMNVCVGMSLFTDDKRSILLFRFSREAADGDYLLESQVRYLLSQLQMEFLEYRCVGVME